MNIPLTPFQSLQKEILKEGTEQVPSNVTVVVHYTGYFLDGRVFDSSVQRNQPFQFQLNKGMVIRGWDIGVASMKRGEICHLYIPSSLAYGQNGAGAIIPPNTDLIFKVELLNWY
jgi:FKBP-type peptidyl-prolyl cis-trans isomerase